MAAEILRGVLALSVRMIGRRPQDPDAVPARVLVVPVHIVDPHEHRVANPVRTTFDEHDGDRRFAGAA